MGTCCSAVGGASTETQETSNSKNPAVSEPHSELGQREHAHSHVDKHGQLVSDGDGHRVFSNKYYAAREEANSKAALMHKVFRSTAYTKTLSYRLLTLFDSADSII